MKFKIHNFIFKYICIPYVTVLCSLASIGCFYYTFTNANMFKESKIIEYLSAWHILFFLIIAIAFVMMKISNAKEVVNFFNNQLVNANSKHKQEIYKEYNQFLFYLIAPIALIIINHMRFKKSLEYISIEIILMEAMTMIFAGIYISIKKAKMQGDLEFSKAIFIMWIIFLIPSLIILIMQWLSLQTANKNYNSIVFLISFGLNFYGSYKFINRA